MNDQPLKRKRKRTYVEKITYNEQKRFLLCFIEGENSPTVRHNKPMLAFEEAGRLAEKTGKPVIVSSSIAIVTHENGKPVIKKLSVPPKKYIKK